MQFLSLVKKLADLLNLVEDLVVGLIQKALNSAARWTFSTLGGSPNKNTKFRREISDSNFAWEIFQRNNHHLSPQILSQI